MTDAYRIIETATRETVSTHRTYRDASETADVMNRELGGLLYHVGSNEPADLDDYAREVGSEPDDAEETFEEHQAKDPHCTCNDCMADYESRIGWWL